MKCAAGFLIFDKAEETGGSTWLLHGMPPKCYQAGSQGPCDFNQVFLPKSQNSNHGKCMSLSHDSIRKLISGDREHDISQKFVSYNRIKRQITTDISEGDVNEGGEPSYPGPGFIGKDIPKIECRDDEVWSELRKRCVRIFSCGIC
ncbi:unnamed protein product [Orchesella dallaii]|uniref:Uncharacterized protein n=1 Tax=Orchesella dallaii TaxID=48710 RepID=A0ABP1PP67_9HEXA